MREFDKFCNNIEKMSKSDLDAAIARDAPRALVGLTKLTNGDVEKGLALLSGAAMAAASVDGKLHHDEYRQINSCVSAWTGHKENAYTFDEVKALVEEIVDMKTNNFDDVKAMYVALARVDEEGSIAFICFLAEMIAVDGDASWKERKWLKAVFE